MSKRKSDLHNDIWSFTEGGSLKGRQNINNYNRLFNQYKMLSMNRFRWENLPRGMESKFIEEALFTRGQAFFYIDDMLGPLCLPCTTSGMMNIYGEPLSVSVFGLNGFTKVLRASDGVLIRNNDLKIPSVYIIDHYARKMNNIDWHINRNLQLQAKPYILVGNKETVLSLKNIEEDIKEGKDSIIIDKTLFDTNGVPMLNVLPTLAPYLVDKLQEQRACEETQMLTSLGYNNNPSAAKAERLLVDEINVNNEYIRANLDNEFKNRELACIEINKKFNISMSVTRVVDLLGSKETGYTPMED